MVLFGEFGVLGAALFLEFGFEGEAEGVNFGVLGAAVFLEFGFEGEAVGFEVVALFGKLGVEGAALFLEFGFEGEAVGFEVVGDGAGLFLEFGFEGEAVGVEFGVVGQAEGFEVLGGGQVAVEQVNLFVGQGFGLFGGEAAFDEVLDEPVGVEGSCGSHNRGIIRQDGGGCNRVFGGVGGATLVVAPTGWGGLRVARPGWGRLTCWVAGRGWGLAADTGALFAGDAVGAPLAGGENVNSNGVV